ncbi:hypothetical protein BH18ACI4_BH18ACI4_10460 [soil metagenome]
MKAILYFVLALIGLLLSSQPTSAQSTESKIELGPQFTALTLFDVFEGDVTEPGFGGRLTYNVNSKMAVEAEGNFFPNKNIFSGLGEGRAIQAQFGVKVGKRFSKFGIFGKARPGFLSVGEVLINEPGSSLDLFGSTHPNARIGRKTHFTSDLGGVLEFYPTPRSIVRFDAGDTIVRYGPHFEYDPTNFPELIQRPARVRHNLQITAGVAFRLGDFSKDKNASSTSKPAEETPRYEVGVHFTSLSLNPPRPICGFPCIFPDDLGPVTEPGLGGRFTLNLTDNIGLEAEGNFYTRQHGSFFSFPSGHIFQGQFGIKVGKRFGSFGIFGKARPGFVGFTQALRLVSTRLETFPAFDNRQVEVGEFRMGTTKYFSTDVGSVVEFYISRRVITRMDLGDTIIQYGEFAVPGFSLSNLIVRRPPETKHNFQFTGGIGFRF